MYNFLRPLATFHGSEKYEQESSSANDNADGIEGVIWQDDSNAEVANRKHDSDTDFMRNLQTEGVSLVASLRANSSIPYGVISDVVSSFNHTRSFSEVSNSSRSHEKYVLCWHFAIFSKLGCTELRAEA
jgi:hypothetical protein